MTYVPETSKRIYTNASAILLLFATYGCEQQPPRSGLPQNAKAGILLTEDNEFAVVDGRGEPVPPCQLCTKDLQKTYGPKCEGAGISPPICRSTINTTIVDLDELIVVTAEQNPCTKTICQYISGEKVCWQVSC
jgi:hypothetical protein